MLFRLRNLTVPPFEKRLIDGKEEDDQMREESEDQTTVVSAKGDKSPVQLQLHRHNISVVIAEKETSKR